MKKIITTILLLASLAITAQEKRNYPINNFSGSVKLTKMENGKLSDSLLVIDKKGVIKKIDGDELISHKVADGFLSISIPLSKYESGMRFLGSQGEKVKLLKWKKIPGGFYAWKSEIEINGKKSIIYLPEMYLDNSKIVE